MNDDQLLVERTFTVELSAEDAWASLANVAAWPEWAPHIRSVELTPPERLGPDSRGRFRFRPVGAGGFVMHTWSPPREWTWTGRAVGLSIRYLHAFEPIDGGHTRLRWRVELDDGRPGLRSRLFAAVYARQIDRAWPRFQRWAAARKAS